MQHARINRVWVNLVSIHGVTLVRKYKVFVVKNCRKPSDHGQNADQKQNTPTHTLHAEKQWHYCSKKKDTNYVVTRRQPTILVIERKNIVARTEFQVKILHFEPEDKCNCALDKYMSGLIPQKSESLI